VASYARAGARRSQESFTRADFLRRLALAGLSAGVAADVLGACSSATFELRLDPAADADATPTGAVQLLAPSGGVDLAVLRAFSQRTGVAVRAASPVDGATLPEALGGDASYDVILAPDHLVSVLAGEGRLRPLDMTFVGNFDYVQGHSVRLPTITATRRGTPSRSSQDTRSGRAARTCSTLHRTPGRICGSRVFGGRCGSESAAGRSSA